MLTEKEIEDIVITLIIHEKMLGEKFMTVEHPLLLEEIRPLTEDEKIQILTEVLDYWKGRKFSFGEGVSPVSPKRYTTLKIT